MDYSSEQKKEYINNDSDKCPACKSEQIEGDLIDMGVNQVYQKACCLKCNEEWNDIYKLIDIERI